MSQEKFIKPDYSKYTTGKDASMLDFQWRDNVRIDISKGGFKSFTSGNPTAKQWVIVCLDRCGLGVKVTNLGCGVHRIEVEDAAK